MLKDNGSGLTCFQPFHWYLFKYTIQSLIKGKCFAIKVHADSEEFDQNNELSQIGKKTKLALKGEDHIFRDLYCSFNTENDSRCKSKISEVKIK